MVYFPVAGTLLCLLWAWSHALNSRSEKIFPWKQSQSSRQVSRQLSERCKTKPCFRGWQGAEGYRWRVENTVSDLRC